MKRYAFLSILCALGACGGTNGGTDGGSSTSYYVGTWTKVDGTEQIDGTGCTSGLNNKLQAGTATMTVTEQRDDVVAATLDGTALCTFTGSTSSQSVLQGTCGTYTVTQGHLDYNPHTNQLELTIDSESGDCAQSIHCDFDKS